MVADNQQHTTLEGFKKMFSSKKIHDAVGLTSSDSRLSGLPGGGVTISTL